MADHQHLLPHGLGYLDRGPTAAERDDSVARSHRVAESFEPANHPEFPGLFVGFGALDQGQLSACTGFGVTQAARMQAAMQGQVLPQLSPILPYYYARSHDTQDDGAIQDSGAYVDDLVWAFNKLGTCPEDAYPFLSLDRVTQRERINSRPPPQAARAARKMSHVLKLEMRRIIDYGDRLLQRTAHSLHLGQVCMVAIPVGWEFLDGMAPTMSRVDDVVGWHFLTILDWRNALTGDSYEFLCGNSWGPYWGHRGTAWLSSDLMKQSQGVWYLERAI